MVSTSTLPETPGDALDDLIDALRDFISAAQRRRADVAWTERMRHKGAELRARVAALAAAASAKQAAYQQALADLSERLSAYTEALAAHPNAVALKARREALARSYEELLLELRARRVARAAALAQSRQLKPRNLARNAFHAMNGLAAAILYHYALTRTQALAVLGTIFAVFATLEITRRFSDRWNDFLVDRVFGTISRPSERYRVNSATLYLLALIIITLAFPRYAVEAAVLILGVGDPAASLVGMRWGRRKLFRDKSYAGTLAFIAAGFLAVLGFSALTAPATLTPATVAAIAAVAAVGALTELLSSRIDDNLSVPIACAAAGAWLLG